MPRIPLDDPSNSPADSFRAIDEDDLREWAGDGAFGRGRSYQGQGRAGVLPEELGIVARAAREAGLLLDPVYTAKAFLALSETARRVPGRLGRRVLFWHTGGGFGVFPFRDALAPLLDPAP